MHVQWDAMFVRLLNPKVGELLHERLSGKRGGTPQLAQPLARAHKAGPNIGAVSRLPPLGS
jgi:hypothetical protein